MWLLNRLDVNPLTLVCLFHWLSLNGQAHSIRHTVMLMPNSFTLNLISWVLGFKFCKEILNGVWPDSFYEVNLFTKWIMGLVYQANWIRHGRQNNYCSVWIPQRSYNTTLYTTRLCYEHRHDVVKFCSVSGTADTVQRWWLNQPWLMTDDDKLPFFLKQLMSANANCGWHGAVRYNLTGSRWFYYPDTTLLSFPTCLGPRQLM